MGSYAGACIEGCPCLAVAGPGVSDGCDGPMVGDHSDGLEGVREFGSDGDHADCSVPGLEEFVHVPQLRRLQQGRVRPGARD